MEHRRIHVYGRIQGVGFRPFVWRLARENGLAGWVRNQGSHVLIEVQGSGSAMEELIHNLRNPNLPRAVIDRIDVEPIFQFSASVSDSSPVGFHILESTTPSDAEPWIPPDAATCPACLEEMANPIDRRFGYPFIQCNDCGPRFTIIESLPFDRARTTMRDFSMCTQCEDEYRDPHNRRFHCQTIACPKCGPRLQWIGDRPFQLDPIASATDSIRDGRIVAIKGIGGFHLACDARNEDAIARLRRWKGRGDKPLAVMVRDLEMARSLVDGPAEAWHALNDWIRPIVLMQKNRICQIASRIAPGLATLGVMLPYSPVHHLLLRNSQGPWVMTSGNRSDEPLAIENDDAIARLSEIADGFLMHDRRILEMCDDSVIRYREDSSCTLRRSRGMVPSSIALRHACEDTLASGADLKGTFCIVKGNRAYVSQPFGDLANRDAMDSLRRTESRWEKWLGARPIRIAADSHPLYHASRWAMERASQIETQPLLIQHHHAHLAALAAEYQRDPDAPFLGFVFDGTGYGEDGTIWGGEVIALHDRCFERIATLEHFQLPGGDAAVRFPCRVALALLHHADIPWSDDIPCVASCEPKHNYLFKQLLERRLHCVATSSMGRLFDGVASLLGVRHSITYEAQAAIELEVMASQAEVRPHDNDDMDWLLGSLDRVSLAFPTAACVRELVGGLRRGTSIANLARWFHHAIAAWMVIVASRYRDEHGSIDIGLSGGVFQNELLSTLATNQLEQAGFRVRTHQSWPCHDGSIALGQAWIACHLPEYPH